MNFLERNTLMRYIRTKSEFIDISNYIKKDSYYQDTKTPNYIGKEEIIKESCVVEELCDEFVWDKALCFINFQKGTLKIKGDYHEFDLMYCLKIGPIFGAIWTDKGLIYKAKMKGILNGGIDWELVKENKDE